MKQPAKGKRLPTDTIRRINDFAPLWVKCRECSNIATANADWSHRTCQCKCESCGAIYQIPVAKEYARQFVDLLRPIRLLAGAAVRVYFPSS